MQPRENDPDKARGFYPKFKVERINPESQERHRDCEYFVLDVEHDAFAVPALEAYSVAARAAGYEALANDIDAYTTAKRRQAEATR